MSLTEFSTEEIKEELDKRIRRAAEAPKPLDNIDFQPLLAHCQAMIEGIIQEGYPGKDADHYTFEAALECVYGDRIWDWWNENTP